MKMEHNAIILAAGKSTRFAPFTYEKPKGLFIVRGEVLIERQINQLIEARVSSIYIVIGYMKEKFFYLEEKYPGVVHLIVNNQFGKKGNLYSLYVAREYLSNTFICCADHYFLHNPFFFTPEEEALNHSYRACTYLSDKFREFAIKYSDANVITGFEVGGHDSMAMVGQAYLNEGFSSRLKVLMESEINDFGIASMFWEEFYALHQDELTFYMKEYNKDEVWEFDSIEDLRTFDSDFLLNVDSEIVSNICSTLHCEPNAIKDITVINAGLTNVSFRFEVNGTSFVYRHPGGTAGNLIDRSAELFAQMAAKDTGIDKSVIKMDLEGWKVSYFVHNCENCNFENGSIAGVSADEQLRIAMGYLHTLHSVPLPPLIGGKYITEDGLEVKIFDDVAEGKKLMKIASCTKGHLEKEFADLVEKVELLYKAVKEDVPRVGDELVLCHNDTYAPNYLIDDKGELFLIDWEYAGINYGANDICCILCRYDWTQEQMERYLRFYVGRELTADEHRYYMASTAVCSFYWFCWGLYKGSVGDDDGFFFLPAYRNLVKLIDPALKSYGLE